MELRGRLAAVEAESERRRSEAATQKAKAQNLAGQVRLAQPNNHQQRLRLRRVVDSADHWQRRALTLWLQPAAQLYDAWLESHASV